MLKQVPTILVSYLCNFLTGQVAEASTETAECPSETQRPDEISNFSGYRNQESF